MIRVYIVTYRKNAVLNRNLQTLWAGARQPERLAVTVLANHPEVVIDAANQRPNLKVVVNATRPANAWGYLARDWNFGILDAFGNWQNPHGTAWCVLAQNDVEWLPGWDEYLDRNDRFDFLSQPRGDQAMALNVAAVRAVGFFDERFSILHFQEFDYFLRAILKLGPRASVNDDHGPNFVWNPVGCVLTKATYSGEVPATDPAADVLHTSKGMGELYHFLINKWGFRNPAFLGDVNVILRQARRRFFRYPREVNWYPFFWDGMDTADRFLEEYDRPQTALLLRLENWVRARLGCIFKALQ
jgi:hypothetical protein